MRVGEQVWHFQYGVGVITQVPYVVPGRPPRAIVKFGYPPTNLYLPVSDLRPLPPERREELIRSYEETRARIQKRGRQENGISTEVIIKLCEAKPS